MQLKSDLCENGFLCSGYNDVCTERNTQCTTVQAECVVFLVIPVSAGVNAVESFSPPIRLSQGCFCSSWVNRVF